MHTTTQLWLYSLVGGCCFLFTFLLKIAKRFVFIQRYSTQYNIRTIQKRLCTQKIYLLSAQIIFHCWYCISATLWQLYCYQKQTSFGFCVFIKIIHAELITQAQAQTHSLQNVNIQPHISIPLFYGSNALENPFLFYASVFFFFWLVIKLNVNGAAV